MVSVTWPWYSHEILNILCIPAEIDAVLARGENLREQWDEQAAEFEEALAAYEAAYGLASWVEDNGPMPSPLITGAEEPTTSSRTSKCPRESEWRRMC